MNYLENSSKWSFPLIFLYPQIFQEMRGSRDVHILEKGPALTAAPPPGAPFVRLEQRAFLRPLPALSSHSRTGEDQGNRPSESWEACATLSMDTQGHGLVRDRFVNGTLSCPFLHISAQN